MTDPTFSSDNENHQNEELHAFVNQDKTLMESIYRQGVHQVIAFVLSNNGTQEDAHDVFQEAILAAWLNAVNGKFKHKQHGSLKAYIFSIAKNKWIDALRRNKEFFQFADIDLRAPERESFKGDIRMKSVLDAVSKLDVPCRQLLIQFYFNEFPLSLLAKRRGVKEESIRSIEYRCMTKLRVLVLNAQNQHKS